MSEAIVSCDIHSVICVKPLTVNKVYCVMHIVYVNNCWLLPSSVNSTSGVMYHLAAECAPAASLEAEQPELEYLKATAGSAAVVYEVVQVPDVDPASRVTSSTPANVVV